MNLNIGRPALLAYFVLLISSPGWALAPSSPRAVYFAISEEVREMPAWELLEALHLLSLDPAQGIHFINHKNDTNGYQYVQVYIPPPKNGSLPQGLDILFYTLGESDTFTFIYNPKGRLIAVFPDLKKAGWRAKYFDFSAYYIPIPPIGDPQARRVWSDFADQWNKDQKVISTFGKDRYGCVNNTEAPFVYIEFDKKMGPIHSLEKFNPADINKLEQKYFQGDDWAGPFKLDPHKNQCILPVFPTVYSPADDEHQNFDKRYKMALYKGGIQLNEDFFSFSHLPNSKILVMGPGSGIEVWFISLLFENPAIYAAGINPLEVANTKASAKSMRIKLRAAKVHDNILSSEGSLVYPCKFDRIIWSMPMYDPSSDRIKYTPKGYTKFFEGGFGPKELENFLKGLDMILAPEGECLFWNIRLMTEALKKTSHPFRMKIYDGHSGFCLRRDFEYHDLLYFISRNPENEPQKIESENFVGRVEINTSV